MNSYTNDNTVPGSYTQSNSGMRGGTNAGATSGRKLEGIVSGIHGVGGMFFFYTSRLIERG